MMKVHLQQRLDGGIEPGLEQERHHHKAPLLKARDMQATAIPMHGGIPPVLTLIMKLLS